MYVMKKTFTAMVFLAMFVVLNASAKQQISLNDGQAEWVGNKIFYNECGAKIENLIAWNEGEDFISLGIGHFIWYSKGKPGPFDESFPALLKFIKERGGAIPGWLKKSEDPHCPWRSREEFLRPSQDPKVRDLREFLIETRSLQLRFIVDRLNNALPKMLKAAPEELRPGIEWQFYRMAATQAGIYALVDYVNFKGEGTLATESYKGHRWGLLQVLERMNGSESGAQAVREFAQAAEDLLTDRVNNSPPPRNEKKWLAGWKKRLNTYIDAAAEKVL